MFFPCSFHVSNLFNCILLNHFKNMHKKKIPRILSVSFEFFHKRCGFFAQKFWMEIYKILINYHLFHNLFCLCVRNNQIDLRNEEKREKKSTKTTSNDSPFYFIPYKKNAVENDNERSSE